MGNVQQITRFEVLVNQYGWIDPAQPAFQDGNRECVRRSLPESRVRENRQYCPRSGLAKDVFSLLVSFFLFGNKNPIF